MEQFIVNILISASIIFLISSSFSIIFSAVRFFHFTHAVIITFGAYSFFAFSQVIHLSIYAAFPLALIAGTGLGWLLDWAVYRPMRHRDASSLVLLLSSLGLYTVIQNVISLLFGDDTKIISNASITPALNLFGALITPIQLILIGFAIIILLSKTLFIDKTKIGLIMRAITNNQELAKISGIEIDKVTGICFCLGSFIASTTGILQAYDVGMTPTMGLPMLLLGIVVVVINGNGKTCSIALISFILATLQQIAGWQFGAQWGEVTAFILLLSFLAIRPKGIFRKQFLKTEV